MTRDEYNLMFHRHQLNLVAFKQLMYCDEEVLKLVNAAIAEEREAMVAEAAKRGLAMKNEDPFEDYVRDIANDRARGNT